MAAAAADAEERAERFVGLLPGGGGRPLFVDILQWELGLDQKRKVVVRGQERLVCWFVAWGWRKASVRRHSAVGAMLDQKRKVVVRGQERWL